MQPQTRAWLIKELGQFDGSSIATDVGTLAKRAADYFKTHYAQQTKAWEMELRELGTLAQTLKDRLSSSTNWPVLLEYDIPRRQRRPDVILIAHNVIFVIEFKFGAVEFDAPARWQVENYSLDLRDFHAASSGRPIIPILVASDVAPEKSRIGCSPANPISVWHVQLAAPVKLSELIVLAFEKASQSSASVINALDWDRAFYKPSLNIIEAAQKLFAKHSVADINHAHAANLQQTTNSLVAAIQRARDGGHRIVCFVTGVPGAGKTLTGLNAVHSPELRREARSAGMFLSGNGPLIRVITAALSDDLRRSNAALRKHEIQREIGSFIRNVHSFINYYARDNKDEPPHEYVVVFDEAQRAWSAAKMLSEDRGANSEPELMLQIMERLEWCAIIALVGGGQEIHDGEAGLEEWGRALKSSKCRYKVFASPEALEGGTGVAGHKLFESGVPDHLEIFTDAHLHLGVSERSYRAQVIAEWVNRLLADDRRGAADLLRDAGEFPLVMTRDLVAARTWLHARAARDTSTGRLTFDRRCGLVASSEHARARAYGLEVSSGFRKGYPYSKWFLDEPASVFSSCQLEVVATEFECQGLELDWIGVCWGDDLTPDPTTGQWVARRFYRGAWRDVRREDKRRYAVNKYRVLLTRAREGMVIWIPPGDASDGTRPVATMDATADFLQAAGVARLES